VYWVGRSVLEKGGTDWLERVKSEGPLRGGKKKNIGGEAFSEAFVGSGKIPPSF